MIKIEYLTKRFEQVTAVDRLSLNLEEGITGLVGENGAGKSTLLRLIAGVLLPDEGRVLVDGQLATSYEAKKAVFFLPDDPFAPSQSNLSDLYRFYSCFYDIDKKRYLDLIHCFSLPMDNKISTFSKGMKRQSFMALSLSVTSATYFLLDEAFDGLDPLVLASIKGEIIKEEENGKSFLISSHNISAMERLVDRTVLLYKGKLSANQENGHMGEGLTKFQICFANAVTEKEIEELGIKVISYKKVGSISHVVIVNQVDAEKKIKEKFKPLLMEKIPIDPDEAVVLEMLLARKENSHE